ncbi:MAG: hypothetical protein GF313_15770 [Caldithrix sp.]|nr:hypothetical protein [Caldithrix sp.]
MREITLKRIFVFWVPLAATWLMMSAEGPFLAAIIARLADPKYNLAAYGVAFSFGLIIEAPVIMMLSASTALVKNKQSYLKLRRFTFVLNGLLTVVILIAIIPDVFYFITVTIMELPHEVVRLTHGALILLIPWPGAIGYRRFYQGLLIRHNKTRLVAYGTVIRLGSMALTALIFYVFFHINGAWVGAAALSAGVTAEGLISRFMANNTVKELMNEEEAKKDMLSYGKIFNFYYPLALTSLLGLTTPPLVTFFLGQGRMAVDSLAVFPVVNSFLFIFRSIGLSYQEVAIAFLSDRRDSFKKLQKFAALMILYVTVVIALITFSPLFKVWFHHISGLSLELTDFAHLPVVILMLIPAFSIILAFERAIMVYVQKTGPVTMATGIELAGIFLSLTLFIHGFYMIGVVAAAIALMIGRLGSVSFLLYFTKKYMSNL